MKKRKYLKKHKIESFNIRIVKYIKCFVFPSHIFFSKFFLRFGLLKAFVISQYSFQKSGLLNVLKRSICFARKYNCNDAMIFF